jgi:folate-binding protein YgfZ
MTHIAHLPARAVLRVSGADRVAFLNGLVSNDVALVAPGRAVWAALLTPQGKYLADFFMFSDGESLLLDCDASQSALVAQRLLRFRLRADVAITPVDVSVYAAWGGAAPAAEIAAPDPRLAEAGTRLLEAAELQTNTDFAAWDRHRLALGLPDGPRDLEAEKTVLLEAGFDELGGISWTKGCYMGQELTARTRYRGLIKRRLLPVQAQAGLPPHGTVLMQESREIGEMRSSSGDIGLAVLRIDALSSVNEFNVSLPNWLRLPEQTAQPVA